MKKIIFTIAMLAFASLSNATITIVDINGAGQFTSIQAAIDNSFTGDTIQVWPGTYNAAININKNIVLQGSGYENTIITSSSNPTITMSNGLIKWFMISSTGGEGIKITSGKILNCVIRYCASNGIQATTGNSYIQNCIVLNNSGQGIYSTSGASVNVVNTISRNNSYSGFFIVCASSFVVLNCNGSGGTSNGYSCNIAGQNLIDSDPIFVASSISSPNYHLSTGSPCFDTGQPSLSDPDGSVSDMGYFGGPDCPIFPVVYQMTISPNGSNINVQAKARANY